MFIRAMENNEEVLQALQEFENMTDADKVLTEDLEDLLSYIAKTGRILFPWNSLKPVFLFKLDKVMREFFESSPSRNSATSQPTLAADFEIMRHRLLDCLDSFTSAPFTIQRLCELMVEPRKHYNNSDKFMRGVEKNVLVVSTLEIGSDEIAVFGLTNNIDGSHILSSIPNGPVTNGVMTPAAATGGNAVTEDGFDERNASHVTPEGMTSSRVPDTRLTPLNAQENGFHKHDYFLNTASAASEDKKSTREGGEIPERKSEQANEATVQREEAPTRGNAQVALEVSREEKVPKGTSGAEHEVPVSDSESTSMPEETKEQTEIQKTWQANDEEPMDEN